MKIKDNESYLSKYRAMKKSIAKMQFLIAKICNFIEKLKNLLKWSDPQKTFYFFIVIFILYVLVSRILIRALILIGILDKFFTGKRFYSKVYDRNAKLSAMVLKYIVNKNFPDLMKILDQDAEWPQNILHTANHKKVNNNLGIIYSFIFNYNEIKKKTKNMQTHNNNLLIYF